jgi:hypothetical protein
MLIDCFLIGKKLPGTIFLHRISDPCTSQITTHNLKVFQKFCGADSLKNIAVVTTMRDTISEKRDAELKSNDSPFEPLTNRTKSPPCQPPHNVQQRYQRFNPPMDDCEHRHSCKSYETTVVSQEESGRTEG